MNSHKITALDWGHWDPVYAYAGGADPSFPAREPENSSIIEDAQGLMLVDSQQRSLLTRGSAVASGLSPELSRCLNGYLQQLAARSRAGQGDQARGFYCAADDQSVIGAGTSIRRSSGTGPERGWLLHFSRIPGVGGTPAPAVSELRPAAQLLTLKPAIPAWRQRWTAIEDVAPGWLGVNGLVAGAAAGTLLSLRQWRRRDLQMERAKRNQLRLLRQELPGPLLIRSELLQVIHHPMALGRAG